eukprot:488656_1
MSLAAPTHWEVTENGKAVADNKYDTFKQTVEAQALGKTQKNVEDAILDLGNSYEHILKKKAIGAGIAYAGSDGKLFCIKFEKKHRLYFTFDAAHHKVTLLKDARNHNWHQGKKKARAEYRDVYDDEEYQSQLAAPINYIDPRGSSYYQPGAQQYLLGPTSNGVDYALLLPMILIGIFLLSIICCIIGAFSGALCFVFGCGLTQKTEETKISTYEQEV